MTIRRYPLSAANGRAIPAEVFGAVGYNEQAITTSVLGTLIQDSLYEDHLLWILPTEDAIITFSEDDAITGADTEAFFIPADTILLLAPMQEYYDIKSAVTSGTAHINTIVRWDTLGTDVQTDFG